ncbi:unnamed protein product [Rotaria magnacalcarata]|uniref:Uncharacterized protein n=1 Tax=Rotaria magnacalcarata TaxID=392030 RepID=A0A816ZJ84_9BILA|nr:unnamed protein product [Rotaria magnacalcarata]CAF2215865.1 unnamed protein product [Rotaria magnacalcarata]
MDHSPEESYMPQFKPRYLRVSDKIFKQVLSNTIDQDNNMITKFYELKPNREQTHLARKIWQTTADLLKTQEQVEILRKRIYLQRLPSGIDKIINQSIAPIQLRLSNCVFNKDRSASLMSSCSKTIT